MSTDYPNTLEAATLHLNARRDTAVISGAAAKASLEKALLELEIFGILAGDIISNDLNGLEPIRQLIQAAESDFTSIFDIIVEHKAKADAAS